jgi:flagellar basal-body rod protein FlgB
MPALERVVAFTGARHQRIADNIANLSTPNYRPTDLSVSEFQKQLGKAIDNRRSHHGASSGELESDPLKAMPTHDNLLFHDGNDRSLEHTMQALAENTMTHNAALDMLRNQFSLLESAIRGQV